MKIEEIYVYPIKGVRGISLRNATALYSGFEHDRKMLLIRKSDGKNMNTSAFMMLSLFQPRFGYKTLRNETDHNNETNGERAVNGQGVHKKEDGDGISTNEYDTRPEDNEPESVIVHYTKPHTFDQPDRPIDDEDIEIPLRPDIENLPEVDVTMHSSPTTAFELGQKYNDWFSQRVGFEVVLVYIGGNRRKVLGNLAPTTKTNSSTNDPSHVSNQQTTGWFGGVFSTAKSMIGSVLPISINESKSQLESVNTGLTFADVSPYLVVSRTSCQDVQTRVPGFELDIAKFRPNIVVSGAKEAYEEDLWSELAVTSVSSSSFSSNPDSSPLKQSYRLILTQNCARCKVLNIDWNTGKTGEGQAGNVLKSIMKDRRVDLGMKWSPIFGRYGFLMIDDNENDSHQENMKRQKGEKSVRVSVGDEVVLVERNTERTRFVWPGISTD